MKIIKTFAFCVAMLLTVPLCANEMEDAFHAAKSCFERRDKSAQQVLKQYTRDYPYSTYMSETYLMLGIIQTEKEHYKAALTSLQKVTCKQLEREQQPMYYFYRGYAYLKQNKINEAASCFKALRDSKNPYALQGKYYYAYCHYRQGEYDKALPDFLSLESTEQYKDIVPYYTMQIYYAQQQFDEVYPRAKQLLEDNPNNENNGEVHRILGEIYYSKGQYDYALTNLKAYEASFTEQKPELLRADLYLMGMSDYRLQNYAEAITYFKRVKQTNDSISESTCLYLGHAYVKINDIEKAKLSYQAAMNYNINPRVREEAMYNYALTTYQTGTALGESITAFNDFLTAYPKTAHAEQVYRMLAAIYMSSKNYTAALEAVERIANPNSELMATKQYLRYQLGADAFVQGRMDEVIRRMDEVISTQKGTTKYKTDALYYRAEANYRLKHYEQSYNDLKNYFRQSNVSADANNNAALYLQGYALFQMGQYGESEHAFRQLVARGKKVITPRLYTDALNRIGDCCFNARAFDEADKAYAEVITAGEAGTDYAMFQRGYVLGLKRQYDGKADMMNQLVKQFPQSDYADDALYETARTYLQMNKNADAIAAYTQLMEDYPHSPFARKASLEKAMTYRNERQYTEAIAAYKYTIESFAGSEEAYAALDGLEQVCVESNGIADYISYTKTLGRLNMSSGSQEDSLVYAASELQYMLGHYDQAAAGLTTYRSRFCPGGRYCVQATYYAADSYYRLKNTSEALELYAQLSELSANPYMEECCVRAAEITFDNKDYATARTYFRRLSEMNLKHENHLNAMLGDLRCCVLMNDSAAVIDVASRILTVEPLSQQVRDEALYNRAKAYYRNGTYAQAIIDFIPLSKDVRVASGAEAKYLLADCYYRLGAIDDAEKEIMSFAGMKTQHQYWLAKSLILLADINVDRGELFQAKQYLKTLQANYKGNDDILTLVNDKMQAIDNSENNENNEQDNEDIE